MLLLIPLSQFVELFKDTLDEGKDESAALKGSLDEGVEQNVLGVDHLVVAECTLERQYVAWNWPHNVASSGCVVRDDVSVGGERGHRSHSFQAHGCEVVIEKLLNLMLPLVTELLLQYVRPLCHFIAVQFCTRRVLLHSRSFRVPVNGLIIDHESIA